MWNYEKRLQFPVKITQTNPKIAQVIISQYGGPDGELAASMRYLAQRYTMPYNTVAGLLTDIGTEELAHFEMICAIVYQLTRNLTPEEIEKSGFDKYYVDHTLALWPQAAGGIPFNACEFQSKGDVITDLTEDLAAEATLWNTQLKSPMYNNRRQIISVNFMPATPYFNIINKGLYNIPVQFFNISIFFQNIFFGSNITVFALPLI